MNISKCKHIYTTRDEHLDYAHIQNPRESTTILPLTRVSSPSRPGYSLHGNLPYYQVCADRCSSGHQPSGSCHLHGWFWHSIFQGYDIPGHTGLCTHSYEPHATCIKRDRSNPCQFFKWQSEESHWSLVHVGTKGWFNWQYKPEFTFSVAGLGDDSRSRCTVTPLVWNHHPVWLSATKNLPLALSYEDTMTQVWSTGKLRSHKVSYIVILKHHIPNKSWHTAPLSIFLLLPPWILKRFVVFLRF